MTDRELIERHVERVNRAYPVRTHTHYI
jgi:hypothetical protein